MKPQILSPATNADWEEFVKTTPDATEALDYLLCHIDEDNLSDFIRDSIGMYLSYCEE